MDIYAFATSQTGIQGVEQLTRRVCSVVTMLYEMIFCHDDMKFSVRVWASHSIQSKLSILSLFSCFAVCVHMIPPQQKAASERHEKKGCVGPMARGISFGSLGLLVDPHSYDLSRGSKGDV